MNQVVRTRYNLRRMPREHVSVEEDSMDDLPEPSAKDIAATLNRLSIPDSGNLLPLSMKMLLFYDSDSGSFVCQW